MGTFLFLGFRLGTVCGGIFRQENRRIGGMGDLGDRRIGELAMGGEVGD